MKRSGFTIIELVMVIVIMGILAAMVLPRFINLNKRAELSVAKHLEGVLKEAHEFYYLRLVVDRPSGIDPVAVSSSFWSFVAFSDSSANDRDTIVIGNDIRGNLQDPNAILYQGNGTILMNFKNGGSSTYFISPTGAISAEYAGF